MESIQIFTLTYLPNKITLYVFDFVCIHILDVGIIMKNIMVKVVFFLGAFSSYSSWASCDKLRCEGVTNTVLSTLKSTSRGTYVTFPRGTDAILICALIEGNSAVLDTSHPQFKSIHSLLLTAVASNLPIIIEFDSQAPSCSIESAELKVAD
jgi:hypothetical protein